MMIDSMLKDFDIASRPELLKGLQALLEFFERIRV